MNGQGKIKKNRGITLIALVVTIIVLLILAGITISMLTGQNGILNRAGEAKEKTGIGQIEDRIKLAVNGALVNGLGKINYSDLNNELKNQFGENGYTIDPEADGAEWTITVEDVTYKVKSTGEITNSEENPETSDIDIKLTLSHTNTTLNADELPNVSEVTSDNIPIPEGFYYVGGTKDTGVVISDEATDRNKGVDATLVGNQFVWVPVNQNQKLTLEVTSKENITGIKVIEPDGAETELIASGTIFNKEITMTKNGVYTVEVTTSTSSKTASKRITTLYAQDPEAEVIQTINLVKKNVGERYKTTQELLVAKSVNSIEELLTNSSVDSIGKYMWINRVFVDDQEEEFKKSVRKEMESGYVDNNQNQASVNKYGGFYIGRFEAGDGDSTTKRTSSTSSENTLVSKKGAYVYNYVDWEAVRTLSTGMYGNSSNITSVTSQLITGAGWDRTLNWIIETDNGLTENEVIIDSSGWGNYNNSTGDAVTNSGNSNMNYTTGRSEYWKANNIYDLAGNTEEWTQEQKSPGIIARGGNFNFSSLEQSAVYRNAGSGGASSSNRSFRIQLYIN